MQFIKLMPCTYSCIKIFEINFKKLLSSHRGTSRAYAVFESGHQNMNSTKSFLRVFLFKITVSFISIFGSSGTFL